MKASVSPVRVFETFRPSTRSHSFAGTSYGSWNPPAPRRIAGPDDRVEELVVLADEVVLAYRLAGVPVGLPRVRAPGPDRPLLRGGEVAGHRIEPDVEPLRVVPVERDRDPPVEVAGDRRRVEPVLEEVLRDAQRARTPMPLAAEILGEPFLELVELEVEVFRGPELGGRPAEGALRAYELAWLQGPAAVVALVAAGLVETAVRAGAYEVPVRQEATVLGAVGSLSGPSRDEPGFKELEEQLLNGPLVDEGVRAREEVEREPEPLERLLVDRVVALGERCGRDPFFLGSHEGRRPVHV